MTAKQLAEWILQQPSDIQNGEVNSIVGPMPSTAKRVVAYRFKDKSGSGIYVESMGAHMKDAFGAKMEFVSVLNH